MFSFLMVELCGVQVRIALNADRLAKVPNTGVKAFLTPLKKLFGTVLYRYIATLAC
jgi:hypothetical protein